MESWERMAGWLREVYSEDLMKQSGLAAEGRLPRAEHAWRQFCLIPPDFLRTSAGKIDPVAFRRMGAFLMYHWEAGSMGGLSLSNALCGLYNAGFTLLRSYLELILRGVLSQCLVQRYFRDSPSRVLKPTDPLAILTRNLSAVIRERQIDPDDLDDNTILIFDVLHGHWMQDILHLDLNSIVKQVADWGMLRGLGERPERTIGELYGELSRSAHERVEYTDSGRAVEEGEELFEWPAPILKQSLEEFLTGFHLAMEIGVIAVLNQLARQVTGDGFKEMCQRLLENESFRLADMRRATKLVKDWAS
jgi:hypothetical protein